MEPRDTAMYRGSPGIGVGNTIVAYDVCCRKIAIKFSVELQHRKKIMHIGRSKILSLI